MDPLQELIVHLENAKQVIEELYDNENRLNIIRNIILDFKDSGIRPGITIREIANILHVDLDLD